MVILASYLSPGQTNIQNLRGNAHYDTIIGGVMGLFQINRLLTYNVTLFGHLVKNEKGKVIYKVGLRQTMKKTKKLDISSIIFF